MKKMYIKKGKDGDLERILAMVVDEKDTILYAGVVPSHCVEYAVEELKSEFGLSDDRVFDGDDQ